MASLQTSLLQTPWDMTNAWDSHWTQFEGDESWRFRHLLGQLFDQEQTQRNKRGEFWLDKVEEKERSREWENRGHRPYVPETGIFMMPEDEEKQKERHKDPVMKILDEVKESGIWDKNPYDEAPPPGILTSDPEERLKHSSRPKRPPMKDQYKFGGWQ